MNKLDRIHPDKQPNRQPSRPHYVPEWAEHRGYETQAALAAALDTDKSVVWRWYQGTTPSRESQKHLAELFHCDPESLFRHPDDDWLSRFFRGRSREEIEKAKQMLELAFPSKKAG